MQQQRQQQQQQEGSAKKLTATTSATMAEMKQKAEMRRGRDSDRECPVKAFQCSVLHTFRRCVLRDARGLRVCVRPPNLCERRKRDKSNA